MLDAIGSVLDLFANLFFGWRSALCLGFGGAIVGLLIWRRPPGLKEPWLLVLLVALCYLVARGVLRSKPTSIVQMAARRLTVQIKRSHTLGGRIELLATRIDEF